MFLYEFNQLNLNQQAEWIYKNCEHLMVLDQQSKKYSLYGCSDFYCEIIYNPKENVIEDIKSFKQGFRLDKYLPEINIPYQG